MKYEFKYLGNGVYEERDYHSDYDHSLTTGKRDKKGDGRGRLLYIITDGGGYEEVTMVNGLRHGTSKCSYSGFPVPHVSVTCYNMGVKVPWNKLKSAETDR